MNNELKTLVIEEAKNLKVHATQEERAKLDFGEMNPAYSDSCIYGQMTGDCWSLRAASLLNSCTKPFSGEFRRVSETRRARFIPYSGTRDFSPIEFYITQRGAKNETLIDFIKGGRDTLTIEDL